TETCTRIERQPDTQRRWLPFGVDRLMLLVLNRVFRRAVGALIDKDAVGRRPRLDAADRVHDVASSHALASKRLRAQADERLACRDADAYLESALLASPVADRKRRPHRPLSIVLMGARGAEELDHRVPD